MNKYKICVYAVCKNEEKFVDTFMDSIAPEADAVFIGDTGSTDHTAEKFREKGADVFDIPVNPWRFDKARNDLLERIPKDFDICFSLDADETLNSGWRGCIENCWTPTATQGRYHYIWSFNADGKPGVQYCHNRMHSRKGFRWIYPTHEVPEYIGELPQESVFIEGLTVSHHPDVTKSRSFNLELLELALKENPNDVRNTHYLGREYMYAGRYDDSIAMLRKYLSMPSALWNEERSASMRFIGLCYDAKKEYPQALGWMLKAVAELPYIRDPYTELAFLGYRNTDWETVYYAVSQALKITDKNIYGYPSDPRSWGADLYDLGAVTCYYLEHYAKAEQYAAKALSLSPDVQRMQNNLRLIKQKLG